MSCWDHHHNQTLTDIAIGVFSCLEDAGIWGILMFFEGEMGDEIRLFLNGNKVSPNKNTNIRKTGKYIKLKT